MAGMSIIRCVEHVRGTDTRIYNIYITKHQLNKLPDWLYMKLRIHFFGHVTRTKWTGFSIQANDELEAAMRFHQFWAGLPKKQA